MKMNNNKNKNMRSAVVRVSAENIVKKDNKALGIHAGDKVTYTIEDIVSILEDWTKTKYFHYYVIAHDLDSENVHFHIVIEFTKNSQGKFSQIKERFPYGQIDNCKYGVKNCVQYLVHMNNPEKTQYSWDSVITNSPERLVLHKVPGKTTLDMKAQSVISKILSGEIREYQIEQIEPEIYIQHSRRIKAAFEYRQQLVLSRPNRDIMVVVLQGPPRVGKSSFCKAWAEKHQKSICFSSGSNDPWQDYKGQDIFVYDDFNHENTKIEDFLKVLDPHNNTTVSSRYKNRLFLGDTIFICTNTPVNEWYQGASLILRDALYRRFARVLCFGDLKSDGTVDYSINRIIYNDTENGREPMQLQEMESVKTFDLKKYINISSDQSRVNAFVEDLDSI